MVTTKKYATAEDMHLSDDALAALMQLNDSVPDRNGAVWVTKKEIRDRLIFCGVPRSVDQYDVSRAVDRRKLEKRRDRHDIYFRSGVFWKGSPKDQRRETPPIMPAKNYFKRKASTRELLGRVNKDLERVQALKADIKRGEIILMIEMGTQTDLKGGGGREDYDLEKEKVLIARPTPVQMEVQTDLIGGGDGIAYDSEKEKVLVPSPPHDNSSKNNKQSLHTAKRKRSAMSEEIERDANARMVQPPPPPVPQIVTPPTHPNEQGGLPNKKIDYSDGFGLFQVQQLVDFMQELIYHAAQCGGLFHLQPIDFSQGAGIVQSWKCSCCNKNFTHKNCKWIRTEVVVPGRKFSRPQPELNIRIVEAAREVGINLEKLVDFLAFVGVKASKYDNMLHMEKKIRVAIEELSEERLSGNLIEHNVAARSLPAYKGDIVWTDEFGKVRRTARGPGSFDGAGLTRAYQHKIKGSRGCMIVFSLLTGKPIMVAYDSSKCILCTRAYNKANKARDQKLYLDDIRVMEHAGKCWRTGSTGPAGMEEKQATEVARRLLFNDSGEYRGDDEAVFLEQICADNDTRGPKNFIKEQNRLIGQASDGLAEHVPDVGHILKNCSNSIYAIRKNDSSFAGKNLLENTRIKAFIVDVRTALNEYKDYIGNTSARQKCLDKIYAIITHHCGDHSMCKWTDVCRFQEIKKNNPDWTDEKVQLEYAKDAIRFGGRYMDLAEYGIEILQKEMRKRFNEKNIDRLAQMACSNSCEGFFSVLAKFSEGKRLNLEHTDMWKSMILLVFCRTGNIEETHKELGGILGLSSTTAEARQLSRNKRKRENAKERDQSEDRKQSRHDAKVTALIRMGKEDVKTSHRSEKLSTTAPTKSKVHQCTKCGHVGHPTRECPVIKVKRKSKQKKMLTDWNTLYSKPNSTKIDSYQPKAKW